MRIDRRRVEDSECGSDGWYVVIMLWSKVALAGRVSLNKDAMADTHGYAVAPLIGLPGPDL